MLLQLGGMDLVLSTLFRHNMNLCKKTKPVMVGAEAKVYVWFCARSAKMQVNFGTQASHSGTEYFFKAKILKIFFILSLV